MLNLIQNGKVAADGQIRVLKVVGDQQPLWADPFKHVQRTVTAPGEFGKKGIEASHAKGSEKRRYTVQPMFGVVITAAVVYVLSQPTDLPSLKKKD